MPRENDYAINGEEDLRTITHAFTVAGHQASHIDVALTISVFAD